MVQEDSVGKSWCIHSPQVCLFTTAIINTNLGKVQTVRCSGRVRCAKKKRWDDSKVKTAWTISDRVWHTESTANWLSNPEQKEEGKKEY